MTRKSEAAYVRELSPDGNESGAIELPSEFLATHVPGEVIKRTIVNHQANRRRGTQAAKTRGEVRGGGRKPWKQKGTGRARQGSIRAPHWAGGGVVFAPKPRKYGRRVNSRERVAAFRAAVGMKAAAGALSVIKSFVLEDDKTKSRQNWLDNAGLHSSVLLVDTKIDDSLKRSTGNLSLVRVARADTVSANDLLIADHVVTSIEALQSMRREGTDGSA